MTDVVFQIFLVVILPFVIAVAAGLVVWWITNRIGVNTSTKRAKGDQPDLP